MEISNSLFASHIHQHIIRTVIDYAFSPLMAIQFGDMDLFKSFKHNGLIKDADIPYHLEMCVQFDKLEFVKLIAETYLHDMPNFPIIIHNAALMAAYCNKQDILQYLKSTFEIDPFTAHIIEQYNMLHASNNKSCAKNIIKWSQIAVNK